MRLLFVTHAYPRWEGDPAGAFIARLATAITARGHDVTVVTPTDEGRAGPAEHDGVRVAWCRYDRAPHETLAYRGTMAEAVRSLPGLWRFWRLVRALREEVATRARAGGADLVHAHWWIPGGFAVWRGLRGTRTPYAVTLHGTDAALLARSGLGRVLARRVLGEAAAVTTVSRYLGDELRRLRVYTGETAVCPMPAALPAAGTGEGGSPGGGIVTVGRLTRQKRIDLLVRAAARVPDVSVKIVGDGPERARLEALTEALGLAGRVTFTGAVSPDRVAAEIAGADVFAFPARREGFGLAVAEALAAGVPVVVIADGGGATEIGTPGARVVVERPDPALVAEAISRTLRNRAARRAAAGAGNTLRAMLAPDRVAQVFESVYQAAIAPG